MSNWSPDHYLRYADERTRPALDLAARIALESPARVIDLGCGPGNSTAVLKRRWPSAHVAGLDSSADMIARAREGHPDWEWVQSTIQDWRPARRFDLVFSNAALQWLPDHGPLVELLFGHVAPGGALAFQIPSAMFATVRTLIHEIAHDPAWVSRMTGPLAALTMESPAFYYDHLVSRARALDLWETEYLHVMASHTDIIDWMSSTGLRPFLHALPSDDQREAFLTKLRARVAESYEVRRDGKVLFPFRRTFVIAYARTNA
jgi:trans-aconitate 2-methyltransferase